MYRPKENSLYNEGLKPAQSIGHINRTKAEARAVLWNKAKSLQAWKAVQSLEAVQIYSYRTYWSVAPGQNLQVCLVRQYKIMAVQKQWEEGVGGAYRCANEIWFVYFTRRPG